ncbi:diol dehydratase reactivase subunit alpha [Clostridium grantii]|uniref:Diol dehydratase reactivase alpha subunit n=1 Tax=Clostridium grantii DSM 8605 TaxID=1121316 RepID=A0A1M5SXK3_9CLOT|nr:diol dehydratase reactivase subunit alpha [Clostridium grantii]SHH42988.1 diol dehydratase reactivase alpha subunit [Clostridium grantii DSM 8605]
MKVIAGVDVGNSTTEVCISKIDNNGKFQFISSGISKTTGIKGTEDNVKGISAALNNALDKTNIRISDIDSIRINEAAPVIGDTAMETITETIITESTMIGHNPSTPGGEGLGLGITININDMNKADMNKDYVVIIPQSLDYEDASEKINLALKNKIKIKAAIVQKDEAVLICNRINTVIPIVDEIKYIEKIPLDKFAAVEVAKSGHTIKVLSNPYGIATIFNLNSEETKRVIPIAKSLIGIRSAIVIKTPEGEVQEKVIPSGKLLIKANNSTEKVDVDSGAEAIMSLVNRIEEIEDISGEAATNVGGMISSVKNTMAELTNENILDIKIKDILAIDTFFPKKVVGGLAEETFMENAVAVAAMVKTKKLPMDRIASKLSALTNIDVQVAGVEAVMATLGAFTTPGTKLPLAILDIGGGSTDAAVLHEDGLIKSIHLAGAGEMVTMIINSELGLSDRSIAEDIKKYPIAKVESLFHIKMENDEIKFFQEPLEARFFGRIVILKNNEMLPIYKDVNLEKIISVRKSAKERVFVQNSLRALKQIAPMNNLRNIPNVVLVGGSALDFEIPEMILSQLSKYKIVSGRGNIRSVEGPRNAVATGLVMSYVGN